MSMAADTLKTLTTGRRVFNFDKIDFSYSRISRKRLLNGFLAELSFRFQSERGWAYPTKGCNSWCAAFPFTWFSASPGKPTEV
jgi:hypothetical protein